MKYPFLSLILILSFNCFAQDPDPNLFRTWYLHTVQVSDMDPVIYVSEIEPSISPNITILEDFGFYGEAACNTFSGTFASQNPGDFYATDFSCTNTNCGNTSHTTFESIYFDIIQNCWWYSITSEGNALVLTLDNPIESAAVYKTYGVGMEEFDVNTIEVYPNPSSTMIHIKSAYTNIKKIELLNAQAVHLKTIEHHFDSLDVSDLSPGIYFLKIYTEEAIWIKKILKN